MSEHMLRAYLRIPRVHSERLVERGAPLLQGRLSIIKDVRLEHSDGRVKLTGVLPSRSQFQNAKRALGGALRHVLGLLWDEEIDAALQSSVCDDDTQVREAVEESMKANIAIGGEAADDHVLLEAKPKTLAKPSLTASLGTTSKSSVEKEPLENCEKHAECKAILPRPLELRPGAVVKLKNMADYPKYNGKKATCGIWDATIGKMTVHLEQGDTVTVEPDNLQADMCNRRSKGSSMNNVWQVDTDDFTERVCPGFDGRSTHPAIRVPAQDSFSSFEWERVPQDFGIGVVLGPSGSGKSQFLLELAKRLDIPSAPPEPIFAKSSAVCSHPGFLNVETQQSEAIDRLDAVGLNNIPSRLKPVHVLSNGERSRVVLALQCFQSGVVLDDFGAFVDDQGASSMAACLVRQVAKLGLRKMLISTTKAYIVPFLQPDFVIVAEAGKLYVNPHELKARKPRVVWETPDLSFRGRHTEGAVFGWNGPPDERALLPCRSPADLGAADRTPKLVDKATESYEKKVEVVTDDTCYEVANAFEYEFDGTVRCRLHMIRDMSAEPFREFKLGAVVGPSGCGKSTILARFGKEAKLFWKGSQAVISHLKADGAPLEQAMALMEAVCLSTSAALRPFNRLSQGERACAEIARRIFAGGIIDEFTSCLDRATARKVCLGVAKYIRTYYSPKPIVVATVHEDIVPPLFADWVLFAKVGDTFMFEGPAPSPEQIQCVADDFDVVERGNTQGELPDPIFFHPPTLTLTVHRLEGQATSGVWESCFKEHHYLTGGLTKTLGSYGLLVRHANKSPVAFHAVANQPGCPPLTAPLAFREHRLVVLPEWQGFGVGPRLSDVVGELVVTAGYRFFSKTAHPRLGAARTASKMWKPTTSNEKKTSAHKVMRGRVVKASGSEAGEQKKKPRVCFSHQFLGSCGHGNMNVVDELRVEISRKNKTRKLNEVSSSVNPAFGEADTALDDAQQDGVAGNKEAVGTESSREVEKLTRRVEGKQSSPKVRVLQRLPLRWQRATKKRKNNKQ